MLCERERARQTTLCLDLSGRAIARARARAANAVRVSAGMFSLVAGSGIVLFVSGASNLIDAVLKRGGTPILFALLTDSKELISGIGRRHRLIDLTIDRFVIVPTR